MCSRITPKKKLTAIENTDDSHLKTTILPQESIIFIVGQMEIIDNKFYVNVKDINYITFKKKISKTDNNQLQSTLTNLTRTKLLNIYQNITKNLKDTPITQTLLLTTSSNIKNETLVKYKRSKEIDQPINIEFTNANNYKFEANEANSTKINQEVPEKPIKKNKSKKNSAYNQIKEHLIRTTCGSKKSLYATVEDFESNKK
ncbi:27471_t:CDS:2 [Dentiscutata erythropus]|uniref:27471_t:CDS:1 n=1 Tax=Dentiscutata erythropus TaxID=1348616 RepID=A0A9N8ZKD1_9GLOM|nr:27471_t:CDS:2 [Dentiscutata erythropus]